MMTTFDICDRLVAVLEQAKDSERATVARLLRERLRSPESFVTVVGETSTGKSTLINSLIGRELLPTSAEPTTATVVEIVLDDHEVDRFLALFRDGTQRELGKPEFDRFARNPPNELLRLQANTRSVDRRISRLHLFDTPGYNSILDQHEEVLRKFLPESDVVIFVVGYRTGFNQVDQDLLEVVRTAIEPDPNAPVLLVVNRTPFSVTTENPRVREIVANARDSLRREFDLFLVKSATEFVALKPEVAQNAAVLPDTSEMWNRVRAIITAEERQTAIRMKLLSALGDLIDDTDQALERMELILDADPLSLAAIEKQIQVLESARSQSLDAVEKTMQSMRIHLPASLDRLAASMQTKLFEDIDDSSRWLGRDECIAWIQSHALPFEVRQSARSVEESIRIELEELNRRLADLANTTVHEIQQSIHIPSDASRRLMENLARFVALRLSGTGINLLLRSVGGVGGTAAGAGNLVKMLVSRTGSLFGKTFSREVYTQIAKTFTKRALIRLTIALSVIIETLGYVVDAMRWRGELKDKVKQSINEWNEQVQKDLLETVLPRIRKENMSSVCRYYDPLTEELRGSLHQRSKEVDHKRAQLAFMRTEINHLREELSAQLEGR